MRPNASAAIHKSNCALYVAAGIAVAAVCVRVWMMCVTHSTGEDALITLRYAENLAHGRGFVFNPAQRVLGTTTPLYTLLLAVFAFADAPAETCGKITNILADGGTCFLIARMLARAPIRRPGAGLAAALLYAFGSTPISISISGMETGLVTLAGTAAIDAYLNGRDQALYVLGAILFLLRIDGLALFLVLAVGLALAQRGVRPRAPLAFAAIVAPWVIFATFYFGSPVPTSLTAKLIVYAHADHGPVVEAFRNQFAGGWPQRALTGLFAVGALAIVACAMRRENGDGRLAVPLLWMLAYYGAMAASRVPAFGWYFLPPWPLYLAVAMAGAGRMGSIRKVPACFRRHIAAFALCGMTILCVTHVRAIRRDIAAAQRLEDEVRRPMGGWLGAQMSPRDRVLLEPIGYVGYYSNRPVLDIIGLVSPEVLPSYGTASPLADIVRRLRPEWLCLRPGEASLLRAQDPAALSTEYRFVRDFRQDGGPPVFVVYRRLEP